jgi:hypothetical protein
VISGSIPAQFRGISRNFAGIEQKSLQKSKNSAEFRVGGIPWTPYSDDGFVYFVLRIAPERDYESGSEFTGAFTMKKLRRQSTKVADPH